MRNSINNGDRRVTPLKWSYSMAKTNGTLIGCTIGDVLQKAADKFGDEEAIFSCYQNIKKTFYQFNEDAIDCAAGLLSLGLQPGDRIGIWGPNSYEWCITMFAIAKAGLIMVNINPAYRAGELKYCLSKVGMRGIICASPFKTTNFYNILSEVVPEVRFAKPATAISSKIFPNLQYVIVMDEKEKNGAFSFKYVCNAGRAEDIQRVEMLESLIQFDDPFNIQFTSGTTGYAKPAVLSHFQMVNNVNFSGKRTGIDQKKERIALSVPLFHCFGSVIGLLANTLYGSTTIIPSPGFDPIAIMKAVKEERVTSLLGTPTMFFDYLREYRKNPFEIIHLRFGIMAGSSVPENLVLSVMEELKIKDLVIAFGMTENSPITYLGFPDDSTDLKSSTVGYPLDLTESKIVDEDGRIVPIGTPGQLLIRGYCVFLGYWKDEEKTKEALGPDRWFKTGDVAIMNENHYLKFVGRISDMIVRGGENIYPAEIENFFLCHPDISEAQVFGVPDKRMGEDIAMWVISNRENLNEADVKKWAKEKISHFKIPKYVMFVEDFPKTVSGKVKKFEMKKTTIQQLGLENQ